GTRGHVEPAGLAGSFPGCPRQAHPEIEDAPQVRQAKRQQQQHYGGESELHRRLAALELSHQGMTPLCMIKIRAGPSRITQRVGKMQPTMGMSIFSDARAPCS